jgi:hypothetical protein
MTAIRTQCPGFAMLTPTMGMRWHVMADVAAQIPDDWIRDLIGEKPAESKAELIELLRLARARWWEEGRKTGDKTARAALRTVPAVQVGALAQDPFFDTFPPVPLWPDVCRCPLCEGEHNV